MDVVEEKGSDGRFVAAALRMGDRRGRKVNSVIQGKLLSRGRLESLNLSKELWFLGMDI